MFSRLFYFVFILLFPPRPRPPPSTFRYRERRPNGTRYFSLTKLLLPRRFRLYRVAAFPRRAPEPDKLFRSAGRRVYVNFVAGKPLSGPLPPFEIHACTQITAGKVEYYTPFLQAVIYAMLVRTAQYPEYYI